MIKALLLVKTQRPTTSGLLTQTDLGNEDKNKNVMFALIGSVAGILCIAITIAIVVIKKRNNKRNQPSDTNRGKCGGIYINTFIQTNFNIYNL